jgi:hypothetical protein
LIGRNLGREGIGLRKERGRGFLFGREMRKDARKGQGSPNENSATRISASPARVGLDGIQCRESGEESGSIIVPSMPCLSHSRC